MDKNLCRECGKEISPDIPFCPHCGSKQIHLSEYDLKKNPFEILQISSDAESEIIDAAYKALAKKYHPDIDSSEIAQEKMKEINWAYSILKDEKKREEWSSRNKKTTYTTTRNSAPQPEKQASKEYNPPKKKYCPVCKNPYDPSLSYCPYCATNKKTKTKKKKKFIPILIILFIAGCLGLMILPYITSLFVGVTLLL